MSLADGFNVEKTAEFGSIDPTLMADGADIFIEIAGEMLEHVARMEKNRTDRLGRMRRRKSRNVLSRTDFCQVRQE